MNATSSESTETPAEATPQLADPSAEAETAPDQIHIPMKDLEGITYIGTSDVRILDVAALRLAGVIKPKGDLRWDSQNGHEVPISDVNASTLEYLRSQPDFHEH